MAASTLSKCLANPAKVASILDWKKRMSVACLDITKHTIGVAVARHPYHCHQDLQAPSLSTENVKNYNLKTPIVYKTDIHMHNISHQESSKVKRRNGKKEEQSPIKARETMIKIHHQLESIITEYQVCAFLIHWPLSIHGCRMGESCGRVLYTLDQLHAISTASSSQPQSPLLHNQGNTIRNTNGETANEPSSIFKKNRPFALISLNPQEEECNNDWREEMVIDEEDGWGRNSNLGNVKYNPRHFSFSSKYGVTFTSELNDDCRDVNKRNLTAPFCGNNNTISKLLSSSSSSSPSSVASIVLNQFLRSHWATDSEDIMMEEEMAVFDEWKDTITEQPRHTTIETYN